MLLNPCIIGIFYQYLTFQRLKISVNQHLIGSPIKTSFDGKTKSLESVKTENLIPQKAYVM